MIDMLCCAGRLNRLKVVFRALVKIEVMSKVVGSFRNSSSPVSRAEDERVAYKQHANNKWC